MDPFVRAVQKKLAAKGFDPGPADGLPGRRTTAALEAFQRARSLPVTGMADEATWKALDDAGERAAEIAQERATVFTPEHPDWEKLPALPPAWPRQAEVSKFYGSVGTNQTMLILPFPMKIAWDLSKSVSKISVHAKVHASAARVFERIADAYDAEARAELGIDIFGGSLNVRKMRGGSAYSMHSWGIAIDFDPIRNQLKWGRDRARLAKPDAETFWKLWEEEGWLSLGRARNYDWMHVQAARL